MDSQLIQRIVKFTIIGILFPVWWPVAKAMWQEIQDSLREEGGLLGRRPSRSQLARIEAERGVYYSPMVSEPWSDYERAKREEEKSGQSGAASRATGAAPRGSRGSSGTGRAAGGRGRGSAGRSAGAGRRGRRSGF